MEGYQANMLQLNAGAEEVGYGRVGAPPPPADGLFHPLACEPTLHIGYWTLTFQTRVDSYDYKLMTSDRPFNNARTKKHYGQL